MIAFKLAYRNLIGAGLRTWLNVFVLSLSFVVIIWHKGVLNGWDRQARSDTINEEVGGGQYWHEDYDPYDPFTLTDAHSVLPDEIQSRISQGQLTPILISQATIYPEGRIRSAILKGINPDQKILDIPTEHLNADIKEIPALLGSRMAKSNNLQVGDFMTVRWRDADGIFDAEEAKIVHIFRTDVPAIDMGQMWIPLERLQNMLQLPEEATIVVAIKDYEDTENFSNWEFQDLSVLLAELDKTIQMKTVGGSILWIILLLLAWLAIFDTQVLSIFRRQKEIGTDIALGMTRGQVIRIFTIEGAMHAVLAAILAAIYGTPLLYLQAKVGFTMPVGTDDFGIAISETIFPYYSIGLIITTTLVVFITTTIISFLPTRRIAKMKPTDAIRGKIQ